MKLYMSVNSPYVRIVRVLLSEIGDPSGVSQIELNPRDPATGFWAINPIARIPALELPGGVVITESDLIARYLDEQLAGGRFYAPLKNDAQRLALLGLSQGTLDRGVAARTEKLRQPGPDHEHYIKTQLDGVLRGADTLEHAAPNRITTPDIVDIAVGCTFAWVQFRHPELEILRHRPALAAWCEQMNERKSMLATQPAEIA